MPSIIVRSARIALVGGANVATLRVSVDRSLASVGGPGAPGGVASGAVTPQGSSYVLPALTLYSTYNAPDLVTQGAIYTAELLDGGGNLVTYLPGFDAFQLQIPNTQTTWTEIREQSDFARQSAGLPPPDSVSWLGNDTDPQMIASVLTILGVDTQASQDTIALLFGNANNPPGFRRNVVTALMEYSNDGVNWFPFTGGGGGTLTGAGTVNYLPIWTGASTLGNSPVFYDGGAQLVIVQNNLAAEKTFLLGTDQFIFNGDPVRAVNAIQSTWKAVAGQTGDYLRLVDSVGVIKLRIDADGDIYPRGVITAWPNANASGALTNDGSGNLTWTPSGGGGGITSLNGLTAAAQTFVNDTNVTIVSAGSTHTITWVGALAKTRQNAATVYTDQANTYTVGVQDFTLASGLKLPTTLAPNPTIAGHIGYDTTNNWLRIGTGVSRVVPYYAGNDAGGSSANGFARFTADGTLQASPLAYDTGLLLLYGVDNANFNKTLTLGTDQFIFNGDPVRAVNAIQSTWMAVAGQTGDYLRLLDSASTIKLRVDADGDIYPRGVITAWPNANASGALTNDGSGNLTWTPATGSETWRAVSANTNLLPASDDNLLVDTSGGAVTVTLNTPSAGQQTLFNVKKKTTDANNVVLSPATGNIDNAASVSFNGVIGSSGESRQISWDGTNWWVI